MPRAVLAGATAKPAGWLVGNIDGLAWTRHELKPAGLSYSAPAYPIDRTAAIHRCSCPHADSSGTDTGGHYGSSDRPRHQPDTGSYDATGRITNVLAVDHGTGRFTACDHRPGGDQQR